MIITNNYLYSSKRIFNCFCCKIIVNTDTYFFFRISLVLLVSESDLVSALNISHIKENPILILNEKESFVKHRRTCNADVRSISILYSISSIHVARFGFLRSSTLRRSDKIYLFAQAWNTLPYAVCRILDGSSIRHLILRTSCRPSTRLRRECVYGSLWCL